MYKCPCCARCLRFLYLWHRPHSNADDNLLTYKRVRRMRTEWLEWNLICRPIDRIMLSGPGDVRTCRLHVHAPAQLRSGSSGGNASGELWIIKYVCRFILRTGGRASGCVGYVRHTNALKTALAYTMRCCTPINMLNVLCFVFMGGRDYPHRIFASIRARVPNFTVQA